MVLWLSVLAASYGVYRYLTASAPGLSDSEILLHIDTLGKSALPGSEGKLRIVHFLDPLCPCTAFTLTHLESLSSWFSAHPNEQWVVTPRDHPPPMQMLERLHANALALDIPLRVGPAIAIWQQNGELAYFGPYSLAMVCGEDALLMETLEAVTQGTGIPAAFPIETGCFCNW